MIKNTINTLSKKKGIKNKAAPISMPAEIGLKIDLFIFVDFKSDENRLLYRGRRCRKEIT